jgi:hypothetical protein
MAAKISATFNVDKVTANTVKFTEERDPEDILAMPLIGSLYVPKRTLRDIGWNGEKLTVNVS